MFNSTFFHSSYLEETVSMKKHVHLPAKWRHLCPPPKWRPMLVTWWTGRMVGLLSSRKEPDKDLGVINIVWEEYQEYQGLPVGLGRGAAGRKGKQGTELWFTHFLHLSFLKAWPQVLLGYLSASPGERDFIYFKLACISKCARPLLLNVWREMVYMITRRLHLHKEQCS